MNYMAFYEKISVDFYNMDYIDFLLINLISLEKQTMFILTHHYPYQIPNIINCGTKVKKLNFVIV